MPPDTRDTIRFADRVTGGSSDVETHQVDRPSTIEGVNVRIYRGAQLDLEITPFIEVGDDPSNLNRIPVLTFAGGKSYVDGDNDAWEFPVSIPIDDDERIGVEVQNTDPNNAYDYSVDFELDRTAGSTPLAQIVTRLLGGGRNG
jgi:hypothetical protein